MESNRTYIYFISLVFLFCIGCGTNGRFSGKDLAELKPAQTISIPGSACIKICFLGDLAFGESYQETYSNNVLTTKGYLYSFQKISPLLNESTFRIANLETPITPFDSANVADINKAYLHYADTCKAPKALHLLNIDAVSLANNHALDFGIQGLQQTQKLLAQQNITSFGAGKNENRAALPIKLGLTFPGQKLNIYILAAFQYFKTYDKKYNFYSTNNQPGTNSMHLSRMTSEIRLIKNSDPNAFVIVFPHWGFNYVWKNRKQKRAARKFIRAGADLIIGHGAHRIQEIDWIDGKPVLYSIGNSVFNSEGRFDQFQSIKYSIITLLEINKGYCHIKCYPVLSDNKITGFQPRFLDASEARRLENVLLTKSNSPEPFKMDKDKFGYFFEIPFPNGITR